MSLNLFFSAFNDILNQIFVKSTVLLGFSKILTLKLFHFATGSLQKSWGDPMGTCTVQVGLIKRKFLKGKSSLYNILDKVSVIAYFASDPKSSEIIVLILWTYGTYLLEAMHLPTFNNC